MLAPLVAAAALAVLPGASERPICSGGGIPFPQAALATAGESLWIACRDRGALVRLPTTGKAPAKTVKLPGVRPWALASGFGAVWTIDRDGTDLLELDARSGRRLARVRLPGLPVYVWAGAGSVWVGLEQGTQVARVDPATRRVRLVGAGDGASGFATDGRSVWIVSHRNNVLTRVDAATGRATTFATPLAPAETAAAERVAYAAGSLWITGRGLDLLRVDPETGAVQATIEIGAAGIDVVATGGKVVVAAATSTGARRGDPIVAALRTVDPATNAVRASATASARLLLGGLAARRDRLWLADVVGGRLLSLRVP